MSKYIHAIQINLGDLNITEDTSIGLYNVAGTNYIRWSEYPVVGDASASWTSGIISIGTERLSGDLRNGGCVASHSGYSVVLPNTAQLYQQYKDLEAYVIGKTIIKYEFIGTDADSDNTSKSVLSTMEVEDSIWSETEWTIKAKTVSKDANLATVVNNDQISGNYPNADENTNGSIIPVTFGKFVPELDAFGILTKQSFAKFIRTNNKIVENYYSDAYMTNSSYNYTETIIFPITSIAYADTRVYYAQSRSTSNQNFAEAPSNVYVKIVDGAGVGQIREVTLLLLPISTTTIQFTVDNFFETELSASTDDRSWIQFIIVHRQYDADIWPCYSFVDTDENELTNAAKLYTYEDEKFNAIAPYGYDFIEYSDNNKLSIKPELFSNNDLESQSSSVILPVENIDFIDDSTLLFWLVSAYYDSGDVYSYSGSDFNKISDGIYVANELGITDQVITLDHGDIDSINDKDYDTYGYINLTYEQYNLKNIVVDNLVFAQSIKFTLPAIPQGVNISNCKIGIRLHDYEATEDKGTFTTLEYDTSIKIVLRRFGFTDSNNITTLVDRREDNRVASSPDIDFEIENISDYFYDSNPETHNEYHYKIIDIGDVSDPSLLTGINNEVFDLDIDSNAKYNSYIEGAIIVFKRLYYNKWNASTYEDLIINYSTKIYELCIIFENDNDIKNALYTPFYGRIYNDTWSGRVTASYLISDPIAALEHCKRLENYGDNEAGKEYSSSALIKTTGEGSYLDSSLNFVRAYDSLSFSLQLHNLNECLISNVEKIICRDYTLLSYYDNNGYACLKSICYENPSESIHYNETKGAIEVIPPSKTDVYCQPTIWYCYNNATGEYDKSIVIKNVHLDTYDADICTSGIDNSENPDNAEEIWDVCHALYIKFGVINEMPSSMAELRSVSQPIVAAECLKYKLNIMSCYIIKTAVDYEKGKDFTIFQHLFFDHPHVTNGYNIECVIVEIEKDKNRNEVRLILHARDIHLFTSDQSSESSSSQSSASSSLSSSSVSSASSESSNSISSVSSSSYSSESSESSTSSSSLSSSSLSSESSESSESSTSSTSSESSESSESIP